MTHFFSMCQVGKAFYESPFESHHLESTAAARMRQFKLILLWLQTSRQKLNA